MLDETMMSLHTYETKEQSNQWLPRCSPAPLKAKTQANQDQGILLAFFNNKGLIFMRIAKPKDKINADFIINTLARFLSKKVQF